MHGRKTTVDEFTTICTGALTMNRDSSLGEGVYYDYDAYASFLRRLSVTVIDVVVLLLTGVILGVALEALLWDPENGGEPGAISFCAWIVIVWLYLTVIKRSRWRTLGYRLLGLKIVTTRGTRPPLRAM